MGLLLVAVTVVGTGFSTSREIYAQWGKTAEALKWLETAMQLRDWGLLQLKTDPLLDPLRRQPRF